MTSSPGGTRTRERLTARDWPPLAAFAALLAMLAGTPTIDPHPAWQDGLEVFAHHLGHEINSVWVGVSLLLLVVPALIAVVRRDQSLDRASRVLWAWRAVDAILLDVLIVDGLGKRFVPWGRPGAPERPGFPSGHATFAFLLAWLVWRRYPKLGLPWFVMAALIGWSRAENHAHFVAQIVLGALIGIGLGALVCGLREGVFFPRVLRVFPALRRGAS